MRPFPCSLPGLAAWVLAAGPACAGPGLITTPDMRIEVERASPSAGAPAGVVGLDLRAEVTEAAARDFRFRSMRSEVEVDCRARRGRVRQLIAFSAPGLSGPGLLRTVPQDWTRPSPGAYLALVIQRTCGGEAPAPRALASARTVPAVPPAAEARPEPTPGAWLVQIASSPDAADAQRALGRLPRSSLAGHQAGLEAVSIRGFETRAAAQGFCVTLGPAARGCWSRRDQRPGPSLLSLADQPTVSSSTHSSSTRATAPP